MQQLDNKFTVIAADEWGNRVIDQKAALFAEIENGGKTVQVPVQNFSFAFEMQSGNNSVRILNGSAVLFTTKVVRTKSAQNVTGEAGQVVAIVVLSAVFVVTAGAIIARMVCK